MFSLSVLRNSERTLMRLFPPPAFLRMPGVGIDISDRSLKFCELLPTAFGAELGRYGTRKLKPGTVERGEIVNKDDIAQTLEKTRKTHGFTYAHVSLPEQHSYLFRTQVPTETTGQALDAAIEFSLKENVPIDPRDAVIDYIEHPVIPGQGSKTIDVSVYPRAIIEEYLSVFERAGITVVSLEVEGEAASRSLIPRGDKRTHMIVDIGRSDAGLFVVEAEHLLFSATLDVGGEQFTEAIARALQIDTEKADEIKQEKGLLTGPSNRHVFDALVSGVDALSREIEKHRIYWRENHSKNSGEHTDIDDVILSGGNANLVGLPEYLARMQKIPVYRGNVWANVAPIQSYVPPIAQGLSYEYSIAIGLALRSVAWHLL